MNQPQSTAPTTTRRPGRPRSTDTPAAIRCAAAKLFGEHGFSGTTVRDIARLAGSDPAVVIRHFGSKENLFLEVVALPTHFQALVDGPLPTLGREILHRLVEADDSIVRLYRTLLGALDRAEVRRYLELATNRNIVTPLAQRLSGPDSRLRSQLIAAQIGGLLMSICLEGETSQPIHGADSLDYYGVALQVLIDGVAGQPTTGE